MTTRLRFTNERRGRRMTTWHDVIGEEKDKPYFQAVRAYERQRRHVATVYPREDAIFRALELTPYDQVKVVILGQDPYHGEGQAHGLSFSVQDGVPIPPSLQNIYKELESDLGIPLAHTGNLTSWAQQGVLLLNTVLTVEAGQANSHRGRGWEQFTDRIIQVLNDCPRPLVFVLWGKPAQQKEAMITNSRHLVLKAPHPSPLSAYRGFFGSRPFSRINDFLEMTGQTPIDWRIDQ